MKPLPFLFGILALLALACILTPPLFVALTSLWGGDFPYPYARVFNRVVMVLAFAALIVFRRSLGLAPYLALAKPERGSVLHFAAGIALSAVPASVAVIVLLAGGELLSLHKSPLEIAVKVLTVIPAALLISLLEEFFFRLWLFKSMAARWGILAAAGASSAIYALVHFVTPDKSWQFPGWSMTVGFEYLALVFERLLLPGVTSGLFGLWLVGLVACAALAVHGRFYLCVGLHTGWIVVLKLLFYSTAFPVHTTIAEGVGRRYYLVGTPSGWVAIVCTGALVAAAGWFLRRPSPR